MLVGPVLTREAVTAPRRARHFVIRAGFVVALLGLVLSAWLMLVGQQRVESIGDMARFGAAAMAILAPLQLTVCILFSALFAAAAVAQEKDRKTLVLLLLSDLTNSELVLGRLLASMLTVLVGILASVPLYLVLVWLGGVSHGQVARVMAVTLLSSLVAGSLGSTLALWREKTFQTLAMTALAIVLWVVGWEIVASGAVASQPLGIAAEDLAAMMSPWRAVQAALEYEFAGQNPLGLAQNASGAVWGVGSVGGFLFLAIVAVVVLNGAAIALVRVWNPSREARPQTPDEQADSASDPAARRAEAHRAPGKVRHVWDNPILWRELRTWAYGKKIVVVRIAYLAIFALSVAGVLATADDAQAAQSAIPSAAGPLTPLLLVSVVLVNALAVSSITNERDLRALDLLLATDLSPKEIIFGKLGGVAYNAKEIILLPLALCVYLWFQGRIETENLVFLLLGLLVVNAFAAMLGIHSGMMYPNSRQAVAASIGTVLFLFLGVSTCMRMMLSLSGFEYQLYPFVGIILGGGVGLYAVLAWRNPSRAMAYACLPAPFAMFYAITSFLMGSYDWVFLATMWTFGFATVAMLVPALSEFDIATGRSVARDAD